MVRPLHCTLLLAALSVALATCTTGSSRQGATADASARWACAAGPARPAHPFRLYMLHSTGDEFWPDWGPSWGSDPAQRGPTRLTRLDPQTGATRARDDEAAIGFTYHGHDGSARIARMTFQFPHRRYPMPELTGFEILDGDSLRRVSILDADTALVDAGIALFPGRHATLAGATLALVGDGSRLAVMERMSKGGPAGFGPSTTAATCLDWTQSAVFVSRVMGNDLPTEVTPCAPTRQVVRTANDGSLFVLATRCDYRANAGKLRWYRIDAQGNVSHHDLPFEEYEAPMAVTPDGVRLFVANPRRQMLYAVATASGHVLWQQPYGQPAPTQLKYVAAPNQIELSPDGARLYVISNAPHEPSPGVWVIDARTGAVIEHLLADVRVTGIALSPTGALYVVSPDAGGRLWVLPHGDPHQQRLLRNDLGDRLSGVLIGA